MKKIIKAALLILIMANCKTAPSLNKLKSEIDKASYCKVKSDCVEITEVDCYIGCNIFVNKNEKQKVINLINKYQDKIERKCLEFKGFDCVNNKCTSFFYD